MAFRIIIPARFASTRMPGKPLREIAGKPMIQHVYERAQSSQATEVVIATDDDRIKQAANDFGAQVCMTQATHHSGTERIAEVVATLGYNDDDIIVNLQGDEPLMPAVCLDQVAKSLAEYRDAHMATLCTPLDSAEELFDPHVVKVVRDVSGYALYFSRAPIPWHRDTFAEGADKLPTGKGVYYRHIGLYAYRVGFIKEYCTWPPCPLEKIESLEQLRVMWHGQKIMVAVAEENPGPGIDTEDDLKRVASLLT